MDKISTLIISTGLIAAIVWWFFGNRRADGVAADQASEVQSATITVDGGYSPNVITLQSGKPADITFMRKDRSGCLAEIILPDFGVSEKLPVGEPFTVRIQPDKVGDFVYTCGMRMFSGHIEVV
ncbi:MAG: cupredoxin domain-containing protein [Candidatus Saccharimonadales bacterium]